MADFKLSNKVNPNKVFILRTSELEKRLDPIYYIPEIRQLEKTVRKRDVKPLRYFVDSISSGATPKTAEAGAKPSWAGTVFTEVSPGVLGMIPPSVIPPLGTLISAIAGKISKKSSADESEPRRSGRDALITQIRNFVSDNGYT